MKYDDVEGMLMLLEKIPDPRHSRGVRYKFAHLLLICIYAVLAGYSEATEIAYYADLNREYFKEMLGMEKVPAHDTFSRVLRFTSFERLTENLGEWLRENFPETYERYGGYKVLHIDGKAARGASEKSKGEKPVYHLNAMYEGESIGVELRRIGEKENEITGLPEFLKQFNLEETIVTVDAIGSNKAVIDAIQTGGGHYVVPVKENQKRLLETITEEIERQQAGNKWDDLETTEGLHKGHGRIEKVKMRMLADTSFIYEKLGTESFYGTVARVGIMDKVTETQKDGEWVKTKSRSIMITDVEDMTVETMYKIKTAHWNIEMQHWLLDIQLGEDRKTARRNDAVTNGSILRRFCMALKKKDAELSGKPMNRFLMSNGHDARRIERLLFGNLAQSE